MKALALLALCGCDSLLGLDHVPPVTADAPSDSISATRTVQCDYEWRIAGVGADGTPRITTQPAPITYAHAAVNGMQVPIAPDGTFQFAAPSGKPYELVFQAANTAYFDRDADTCHLVGNFFHRLGSAPPSLPTPVRFDIPGAPPTNTIVRIASTGVRTFLGATPSMTNSWSVDWDTVTELDGTRAAILDTPGDRIYWLAMPITPDYYSIAQAASAPITMINGGTTVIAAAPAAVPQRCVHINSGEGSIAALIQAAGLRGLGTMSTSWAVTSANAPDLGIGEQQPLALTTRGDIADHNVNVSYGNPYAGESDEFVVGVAQAHKLSLGSGAATTVYDSVSYYQPFMADAGCTTTVAPDLSTIAFASAPIVAGAALSGDNQLLSVDPSQPIPVHVTIDPAVELLVFLDEVTVVSGTTTVTPVATFFPLAGTFAIDPSLLAIGHTYMLYLQTRHGQPGAFAFDYRTVTYPQAYASVATTSFTITR